jgi:hypothetical protein
MTVCERDFETIRGCVRKPIHAVSTEIVIVPPLAVRNDWRPGGFTGQLYLESHLHHPSFQTIAFLMEETGEYGEQELNHSDGEVERFYSTGS